MSIETENGDGSSDRSTKDTNKAIADLLTRSNRIRISGLKGQDNIAVGLSGEFEIDIQGNAGNYLAAFNNGPVIILHGNCGDLAGDNLFKGGLIIMGSCGRKAGTSMSGGILVVKGSVDDGCGDSNSNGTIMIDGNATGDIGSSMINGKIIITGDVQGKIGEDAIGGEFYHSGELKVPNPQLEKKKMSDRDLSNLKKYFDHYGINAFPKTFNKLVPKRRSG